MKLNSIILLMRIALVFVFLVGLLICLFWYPFSITLSTGIPILDYDPSEITPQQNVEFYCQLFFYWVLSLPCFVLVLMGFVDTEYARRYGKFNIRSAKLLFKMALILFAASAVFLVGNLLFLFLGWNKFPLLYCIVGGLGIVLSAGLNAARKYITDHAPNV